MEYRLVYIAFTITVPLFLDSMRSTTTTEHLPLAPPPPPILLLLLLLPRLMLWRVNQEGLMVIAQSNKRPGPEVDGPILSQAEAMAALSSPVHGKRMWGSPSSFVSRYFA
jgi:hypothetical protein